MSKGSGTNSIGSKTTGPLAVLPAAKRYPSQTNSSLLSPGAAASKSQNTSIVPVMDDDDTAILGPYNTGIFQGKDRLAEVGSGVENAGAIYIVAGMSERFPVKNPTQEDGSIGLANRNPNLDNSFIYMSSKSNVDSDLNLAQGNMGTLDGTAAILIKSSNVRVNARNGIKLICGTDPKNENDVDFFSNVGIELISGNDDSSLQPIVKGDNLAKALSEITNILDQTLATMSLFAFFQNSLNLELAPHKHYDMLSITAGQLAQNNPLAIRDGQTEQNFKVLLQGIKTGTGILEKVYADIKKSRLTLRNIKSQYYDPDAANISGRENDIRSEFHMVN